MSKTLSIIGGGTAGIFLASFIDTDKFDVTIYEKQKSLGRKFLVAGDGGFNLTHSENINDFIKKYTPETFLKESLYHFTNLNFIDWLNDEIEIPTFIGSSKRVFPEKGIKPITVLKNIQDRIVKRGVKLKFKKEFSGWDSHENLIFNKTEKVTSDINIFSLGGKSWKVTGSDGAWFNTFKNNEIKTIPFQASNCAYQINWTKEFKEKFEGQPFKNIAISIGSVQQKGEIVITQFGIEGNAIYALSPYIREELSKYKASTVMLDFKPTLNKEKILTKFNNTKLNRTQTLKRILKLSTAQIFLIKESLSKDEFLNDKIIIDKIKNFPIRITNSAQIDEAISTYGGVSLDAITKTFELKNKKNNYCIGEMLNWDAPTGGYLIQGCVSMASLLAKKLNNQY